MRVIYGENLTECLAIGMLTCSQLLSPFKQTGSPSYGQNILGQRSMLHSCLLHLFSRFWANHSTSVNQSFLNQGESFHFLTFPYRSAPKRPHLQVKPHHHFSDSQHTECPFWVWGTPTPQLTPHEAEPISLRRS